MFALSECSKLRQTECFKQQYFYLNIFSTFLSNLKFVLKLAFALKWMRCQKHDLSIKYRVASTASEIVQSFIKTKNI